MAEVGRSVERLAAQLIGEGVDDPLAGELTAWLAESRRFRRFAEANRDKIRKKLRTATDVESRRDVRAELCVARLLLADRHIEVAFEAYGSTKGGPDFTLTYGGDRPLNVEVTRLRGLPNADTVGRVVLGKLRQLPPSSANALVITVDATDAAVVDVARAIQALRSRADAADSRMLARGGFAGTREFYDRFLRLGGVITFAESPKGPRAALWTNRSARTALPPRAARGCVTALGGDLTA